MTIQKYKQKFKLDRVISRIFRISIYILFVVIFFMVLQLVFGLELVGKYSDILFYLLTFFILDVLLIVCLPKNIKNIAIGNVYKIYHNAYISCRLAVLALGFIYIIWANTSWTINAIPIDKDYASQDLNVLNGISVSFEYMDELKVYRTYFRIFKKEVLIVRGHDIDLSWPTYKKKNFDEYFSEVGKDSVFIHTHFFNNDTSTFSDGLLIVHNKCNDCFVGLGSRYGDIVFNKCIN